MRIAPVLISASVLASLAAAPLQEPPGGSQPDASLELAAYRIAFTSNRTGSDEIWSVRADGTALEQLTESGGQGDHGAAWSPDGRTLAFTTYRYGGWKLALADADGSSVRRLTRNARSVYEGSPSWSPDGSRLAFMRYRSEQGVWIVRADGTEAERVLDNGRDYYLNAQPSWSSDGQRLLYVSRIDGDYEVCSVALDGSDRRLLTDNEHEDLAPAMSPDGTRIAFYSNRGGTFETYAMQADGSGPVKLSGGTPAPRRLEEGPDGADALNPAWSPDGRWIALVEYRDGQRDIVLVRPDGSGRRVLTGGEADDYDPTWCPLGAGG